MEVDSGKDFAIDAMWGRSDEKSLTEIDEGDYSEDRRASKSNSRSSESEDSNAATVSVQFKVMDEVVLLLQALGRHSISVSQLKRMFRLMQAKGEWRPPYSWRLSRAICNMVSDIEGPSQSFIFEGVNSGLKLPGILKWPATRGFTFCVWFRVDGPIDPVDCSSSTSGYTSYRPFLLALRTQTQGGLEIFLTPKQNIQNYTYQVRLLNIQR